MEKKEILLKLIDYYCNGNKAEFARMLGISASGLSTWILRDTLKPDLVLAKCKYLNPAWLMSGEGEMILKNEELSHDPNAEYKKMINELLAICQVNSQQIQQITIHVGKLTQIIEQYHIPTSYMAAEDIKKK